MLEGLPPVQLIPMEMEIGGKSYIYGPEDGLTIREFYRLQREGNFASTTQIAPRTFCRGLSRR